MSRNSRAPFPAPNEICPHLGLREDRQTCLIYPSSWNMCHRFLPARPVEPQRQRTACLSPAHLRCPGFRSGRLKPEGG